MEEANSEAVMERALSQMREDWKLVAFTLVPYKETGIRIVSAAENIQVLLDDHITKTAAINISHFAQRLSNLHAWGKQLNILSAMVDSLLKVQHVWMYLEPVFASEDFCKQVPTEANMFQQANLLWKSIMDIISQHGGMVINVANQSKMKIQEELEQAQNMLETVQKGLNDYLEKQRILFPRFYFVSNDELLDILVTTDNPQHIQPHLRKCFEGIDKLRFDPNKDIVGMESVEEEYVEFLQTMKPTSGTVLQWLQQVEQVMKLTMKDRLSQAVASYHTTRRGEWLMNYPGQVVLTASQVHWTAEATQAIQTKGLNPYADTLMKLLEEIVKKIRCELSKNERITLQALLTIDVHSRDIVLAMERDGVKSEDEFRWISQLRHYWEQGDAVLRMVNTTKQHGYEYLGNTSRLVITPLTDRCYITLMGAVQMNLGGSPQGPAGTGKTETCKDLSKAMGRQCVVFSCSDVMDYKATGKMFKGIAQTGAWAVFDEFNRIDIEVMSTVAQQVQCIQRGLAEQQEKIVLEGTEISLNNSCAIFVTMNPGYAGRTQLPDVLKAMFRPVAMMVPDYALISEIKLYSSGFLEAKSLAVKLVTTFKLASEQLSSQCHYDYGMRAVLTVVRAAGNLKRQYPDTDEHVLLLSCLNHAKMPSFVQQDIPLWQGILSDVFVGVESTRPYYRELETALRTNTEHLNLQPQPGFINKIMQIYDVMQVRHGLMVVGDPISGKSSAIKILAASLNNLNKHALMNENKVQMQYINPKSMSCAQLYGSFGPDREWTSGVLTKTFRDYATSTEDKRWIVFDGPVDAIWVENLNTVLDDNKTLCLASGERINKGQNMTMMFETQDLEVASPATVSRCGMVYMESLDLGWQVLVKSWMKKELPDILNTNQRNTIKALFDWLLPPTLSFVTKCCHQFVDCGEMHLTMNLLKLFKTMLQDVQTIGKDSAPGAADLMRLSEQKMVEDQNSMITSHFIFSVVWSVGALLDAQSRTKFDKFIRDLCNGANRPEGLEMASLPEDGFLYDYVYTHHEVGAWAHWRDLVKPTNIPIKPQVHDVIVETVETVRQQYFLRRFVAGRLPVLFVGPTGTGKSLITNSFLGGLPQQDFTVCSINFSAQTTADQTHNTIFAQVDKKAGNLYAPPGNKTMCVFVDDLNTPIKECYGAQPPIEVLRQGIDNQQWFDRQTGDKQVLENFFMMAAMGTPGGGRSNVHPRFLRHFNVIGIDSFGEETVKSIFTPIMDSHFATGFEATLRPYSKMIVSATTEIYQQTLTTLLPTPTKPHYVFNIRDFAKVIQGVLMMDTAPPGAEGGDVVARLWVHEVYRVFYDRLVEAADRSIFFNMVKMTVEVHFSKWFDKVFGHLSEPGMPVRDSDMQGLLFAHQKGTTHVELKDGQLQEDIDGRLRILNPRNEVTFPSFIKHVSHIAGVLKQPKGHCLLLGVSGSGRHSATHFGSSISDHQMYQIELTKTYNMVHWRQDMRHMIRRVGESAQPTTFLFGDHQIKEEAFLEDVNMLLKTGYIPDLFDAKQKLEIVQKMKTIVKVDLSPAELYNKFKERVRESLHLVLTFSPVGDAFRKRVRMFSSLVNCCSIDYFQAWPEDGLDLVAEKYLGDVQMPQDSKVKMVAMCKHFHQSVSTRSERYKKETGCTTYVTLETYIELLKTFKCLLHEKRVEIPLETYRTGVDKLNDAETSVKLAGQTKMDKVAVISRERQRWEQSLKAASEKFDGVIGEVLLAAAMVTYLGPYTIDYRQECVQEWHQLCVQKDINIPQKFSLSETIGDSAKIQNWKAAGLPLDEHSVDNAIIATSSNRWPLMIDPQGQANKWIRNMEKSTKLEVIKPSDANYLRTIENCIRFGTPCLLEDVGEELDPILEPVLARRSFKTNNMDCIKLGDHVLDYNKNFKLYITTQLSNPHYLHAVAVKVNLINFGVTPLSLERQLLALLYTKEKPDMTKDINRLIPEIAANRRQLSDMEHKMLEALSATKGSILDDGSLLQTMSSSQKLSEEINEKKDHLMSYLQHRDLMFEHFAPFGRHSAMLFFIIADLASVDPMYQYSLCWFTNLFSNSLEKAQKVKALEPRLKNLTDHFTSSVYQNVCQSLFERHRLLFSLLLCMRVLKGQNAVDDEEWRFLLTGGIALQNRIPNPASEWLQDRLWFELVRASTLPALSGLLHHVQNNSEEWKKINDSPNPETETFPSPWGDDGRLSMLQRLIILRCLRPDKIVPAVKAFICHYMGPCYIKASTCDLPLSYTASSSATPLIFVLSEAADPMDTLVKFADQKGMGGSKMATISLGQGQGPKAEQLIMQAAEQGTWVVLQNCHLAPSWMPQLERICETVLTDSTKTQPSFRLWLMSYPNKHFPVSILQTGIRMTVEPPRGLKANLLHALQDKVISDPKFFNGSNKPKVFQKLLFGLCYFHVLVMERRQFGPIGFNIGYEFSRSDLHHSAKQLQMFTNEYTEVPLDALRYLTGDTNYGGHVKDDKDRRLTLSLLSTLYCEQAVKDDTYRFSESGLYYAPPHGDYQNYISYVQSLPDIAEPEAFGLHSNADVLRDQRETQTLFDSILLTLPKQTAGREKFIEDLSADILSKIPADFNIEEAQTKFPMCHKESMNTVLVHELGRYNSLISSIRGSLQHVLKAIKGWIVMTTELQEVVSALLVGRVPETWRRKSYTSIKPLGSYISDLGARLKYFQDWIVTETPSTFWISGFFFPQAFMTGALQNYGRKAKIPIDRVDFQFEVMNQDSMPAKPESGVYVSGLYMVGARWDRSNKVITESNTNILHDSMPAIWFKPGDKTKITHRQTYWCPVYKTSERRGVLSTTGHSTNFVLGVHLPTATPQNHWVNRGVALLCQLDD